MENSMGFFFGKYMIKDNKEYMEQGVMLLKKIITYMYEIQQMEQLIEMVETQMKACGDRGEKATELVLSNIRTTIDGVTQKLHKCLAFVPEMIDVIDAIEDPQEWEVMACRYIYGMSWEEIADNTGWDYNRVNYLYRTAMKNLRIPAKRARLTDM